MTDKKTDKPHAAKRKKVLKLAAPIILVLLVLLGFAGYRYTVNDYNGNWVSQNLEKEAAKAGAILSEEESELLGISDQDISDGPTAVMTIKNDKAVLELHMTVNKKAYYEAFYNYLKDDLDKSFAETMKGVDLSDPEIKAIYENGKAEATASLPTQKEFDRQIDEQMTKKAIKLKADYDSASGRLKSEIFKGQFNRFSGTFKLTSVNPSASAYGLKKKQRTSVSLKGKSLILKIGKETLTFKRAR